MLRRRGRHADERSFLARMKLPLSVNTNELVREAVTMMRTRIAEPVDLDELARAAGYSPYHFVRVFRSVTGLSPGAFQSALRIEAAKSMLIDTDAAVTRICLELGYESLGSFTSRFTRSVGVPPSRFRRIAREFAQADIAAIMRRAVIAPRPEGPLCGTVLECRPPDAFVWIGIFPKGMPEERPAAGTLRRGDGVFALPAVPDGTYHVLAASLAPDAGWRPYLTGDGARVATSGTVSVRQGAFAWPPVLTLRPLEPTDPPILAPLALLAQN